jgi:hypothetical protein
LFVFLANRNWRTLSSNPLGFFALSLLRQDRPTPMTATIKKLRQRLDNVDFIGTENINLKTRMEGAENRVVLLTRKHLRINGFSPGRSIAERWD